MGKTSEAGILMLAPGRYEIELRKEGFLLETGTVELHDSDTRFVHVVLSPISGGSRSMRSLKRTCSLMGAGGDSGRLSGPARRSHRLTDSRRILYEKGPSFRQELPGDPAREVARACHKSIGLLARLSGNLVFDDMLQSGGFVTDLAGGLVVIEIRRGGVVLRDIREVPASGAFGLDLETGELIPYVH